MEPASTRWREHIAPDEAARFEAYSTAFVQMQARKSARFGPGRALHRKAVLALPATFTVPRTLPARTRHGLFARAGQHPAWVRLSNGGTDRAPDARPDVRGFAIKVRDVRGPGALGDGDTDCQDFLLINQPAFAYPTSEPFVGLVLAAASGPAAVLVHLARTRGPLGALREAKRLSRLFARPFGGFDSESFFSAAPFACGPHAVRARLVPGGRPGPPDRGVRAASRTDWGEDMLTRLATGDLQFDLQLQFFVDERTTPIEDASVDWPESQSPYTTVARLTIPASAAGPARDPAFAARIEAERFDPWRALAEHRPLGEVMRARRAVYFASQQARQAA